MNTTRECGCKSHRTCLICEKAYGLEPGETPALKKLQSFTEKEKFVFCPKSSKIYPGWDIDFDTLSNERVHEKSFDYPCVKIIPDFVSETEEVQLLKDLDALPWSTSQSGRRKQNFGPRANFKKRKLKCGPFNGFPKSTQFIQDRFRSVPELEDYQTVEQCSIEYRPETGACIEPHIDDCWVWGERIVQLNLMSDSVLTMIPYFETPSEKYNRKDIAAYSRILNDQGKVVFNPFKSQPGLNQTDHNNETQLGLNETEKYYVCKSKSDSVSQNLVRIPLPKRSLLVFYGEPRYDYEHCILRSDINERRIVIAYREFTPTYLPGGSEENVGKEIIEKAKNFWD